MIRVSIIAGPMTSLLPPSVVFVKVTSASASVADCDMAAGDRVSVMVLGETTVTVLIAVPDEDPNGIVVLRMIAEP